ncbi:MAG: dTMP kinase [Akkermansiaceae bacterium]|jgi:dTMP kinase|nr:dTMP kinase [Akkermansiaceae bacterium]
MNKEGKLIVIEGIDGTGKSTQSGLLAEHLRAQGREVIESHEPTNGPWGRKLRESATTGRLTIEDELEYFLKDRKQHVDELINPIVKRGGIVILDRYYFSSMAYQGYRGIDPTEIRAKNEVFAPVPDHLIILDLPVKTALERIGARDGATNEFEKKDALQFCRDLFLSLGTETFASVIDTSKSIQQVQEEIRREVEDF